MQDRVYNKKKACAKALQNRLPPKGIYTKKVPPPCFTLLSPISPSLSVSLRVLPLSGDLFCDTASNTPFELSASLCPRFVAHPLLESQHPPFAGSAGVGSKTSPSSSSTSRVIEVGNLALRLAVGEEFSPRAPFMARIAGLIAGAVAQKSPTFTSIDDQVVKSYESPSGGALV